MAAEPYAQWRPSEEFIAAAGERRRRRELRTWRGRATWFQSSGSSPAWQLWWWDDRAAPCSPPLEGQGSALYAYASPSWSPLSDERVVALRTEPLEVVVLEDGAWRRLAAFDDAVAAGHLCRISATAALVVVDHGRGESRELRWLTLDGSVATVYETDRFIGDVAVVESGRRVAWVEWPVGSMPWSAGQLVTARSDGATLETEVVLADAPVAHAGFVGESVMADVERDEWFVPHRLDDESSTLKALPCALADHRPDWVFGERWRTVVGGGTLIGSVRSSVARFDWVGEGGSPQEVPGGPGYLYGLTAVGDTAYALGSDPERSQALWRYGAGRFAPLEPPSAHALHSPSLVTRTSARGVPYLWLTPRGEGDGSADHPGLLMAIHSGPTAYAGVEFAWLRELWLRCGLAVAIVDYRGSTSYGRAYRDALVGHWGEADVADVTSVLDELVSSGVVDPSRVFVRGSSAGGFTALLASRDPRVRGVVAASAVTDLLQLLAIEEEFEHGYVARLVGAASTNDPVYARRSPLTHAADLARRVLLLHGARDPVVPITQARRLAAALRDSGADVELCELPADGHHLRDPAALAAEVGFYCG